MIAHLTLLFSRIARIERKIHRIAKIKNFNSNSTWISLFSSNPRLKIRLGNFEIKVFSSSFYPSSLLPFFSSWKAYEIHLLLNPTSKFNKTKALKLLIQFHVEARRRQASRRGRGVIPAFGLLPACCYCCTSTTVAILFFTSVIHNMIVLFWFKLKTSRFRRNFRENYHQFMNSTYKLLEVVDNTVLEKLQPFSNVLTTKNWRKLFGIWAVSPNLYLNSCNHSIRIRKEYNFDPTNYSFHTTARSTF